MLVRMEPVRAGILDGVVDADPVVAGLVVAALVVCAVLYVVFGIGRDRPGK